MAEPTMGELSIANQPLCECECPQCDSGAHCKDTRRKCNYLSALPPKRQRPSYR